MNEWVLVFKELLKLIPFESISEEVIQSTLAFSEPNKPTVSRYIAARMLGNIAEVPNPKSLKSPDHATHFL